VKKELRPGCWCQDCQGCLRLQRSLLCLQHESSTQDPCIAAMFLVIRVPLQFPPPNLATEAHAQSLCIEWTSSFYNVVCYRCPSRLVLLFGIAGTSIWPGGRPAPRSSVPSQRLLQGQLVRCIRPDDEQHSLHHHSQHQSQQAPGKALRRTAARCER
jgi:hypothetical protein